MSKKAEHVAKVVAGVSADPNLKEKLARKEVEVADIEETMAELERGRKAEVFPSGTPTLSKT